MGSKREISLIDLRRKQEEIVAAITAAERMEREKIGAKVQTITGLEMLADIEANYELRCRSKKSDKS